MLTELATTKAADPSQYASPLAPFVQYLQDALSNIWDNLAAGELSAEAWYAAMLDELAVSYTAAYMAGQGSGFLDPADIANIAFYVGNQAKFLDNFRFEVQSAPQFRPGWKERALQYANGIAAPYWRGATKVLPLPAMPGDGSTQCLSNCKCLWEVETLDEAAGDYDAFWTLGVADHCQTCIERAALWKPLRIRNGRIDLTYISPQTMENKERRLWKGSSFIHKHLVGQHNQQHHGNRGASLSITTDPTWKPSMTRAEADTTQYAAMEAVLRSKGIEVIYAPNES